MFINGVEMYRVEDIMVWICLKGKLKFVESFVILIVIVVIVVDENNNLIIVLKRIKSRIIDFNKILFVN